jgi:hypothetical protein
MFKIIRFIVFLFEKLHIFRKSYFVNQVLMWWLIFFCLRDTLRKQNKIVCSNCYFSRNINWFDAQVSQMLTSVIKLMLYNFTTLSQFHSWYVTEVENWEVCGLILSEFPIQKWKLWMNCSKWNWENYLHKRHLLTWNLFMLFASHNRIEGKFTVELNRYFWISIKW